MPFLARAGGDPVARHAGPWVSHGGCLPVRSGRTRFNDDQGSDRQTPAQQGYACRTPPTRILTEGLEHAAGSGSIGIAVVLQRDITFARHHLKVVTFQDVNATVTLTNESAFL